MITENLKSLTDDEVINQINTIVTDNIDLEIAELKLILAEASGRKLEKKYINIIAERIKSKIQPEPVPLKRKFEMPKQEEVVEEPAKPIKPAKPAKPTFDDVYSTENEVEEDFEKYPVLSFLIGLYKVFAWILLIGSIVIASTVSLILFRHQIAVICGIMFGSIVIGIFLLIVFYSMAEKIKIQIDIEDHLSKLLDK